LEEPEVKLGVEMGMLPEKGEGNTTFAQM